jgi:hypothetical protein
MRKNWTNPGGCELLWHARPHAAGDAGCDWRGFDRADRLRERGDRVEERLGKKAQGDER